MTSDEPTTSRSAGSLQGRALHSNSGSLALTTTWEPNLGFAPHASRGGTFSCTGPPLNVMRFGNAGFEIEFPVFS